MSNSPASSLIHRVVSGRGAMPSPGPRRPPAGGVVYFELECYEPGAEFDPFAAALSEEKAGPPSLSPGSRYRVRVSAGPAGAVGQAPVPTASPITLYLCCPAVPGISIQEARRDVGAEAVAGLDEEFELSTPAECPAGDYELRLYWAYQGDRRKARLAATLSVRLEGTYYPLDENLLTACRIAPDTRLPEHTAILHIEAPEENKIRLSGWSRRERPVRTESLKQPDLALADFVGEQLNPEYIKGNLSRFSRRSPEELLRWFDGLYRRHGERLCVIIADHTISEFPWEMLEIAHGKYLGAVWRVVRWIPARSYLKWYELCVQEDELSGEVLAYLDHEELNVEQEREALDRLATSYLDDALTLRERLSQPLDEVALVYLACHGIFTHDRADLIALGKLKNPSNRLVALSIEGIAPRQGACPLLFVNACHSARLTRDTHGFYGLPEVFLSLVASAYLGTLGPVGSSYAASIAKAVLARACDDGVEPAEVLRELRAAAVGALAAAPTRENWLKFVYTFMYVYYGNPFTRLRVGRPAAPEGD